MSFGQQVKAFAQKDVKHLESLRKAVILELFSSVVTDTPVDTGRARGNWIYTLAVPDTASTTRNTDASGQQVMDSIRRLASGKDGRYHFTNNLSYIKGLEEGASRQAPQGMMRKNLNRVSKWIDKHG